MNDQSEHSSANASMCPTCGQVAASEAQREEARAIVANVNNSVFGSHGYFTSPDCVEQIETLKANHNRAIYRAEASEAQREALCEGVEALIRKRGGFVTRAELRVLLDTEDAQLQASPSEPARREEKA